MLHTPSSSSTQQPPADSKLIFAPGTDNDPSHPSQAAQFHIGTLTRTDLSTNPFTQFHAWYTHPSLQNHIPETCTLSTASLPSGRVSARTLYLKELDARGFVVYSNWATSAKAADIATNRWASLTFWWKPLERQVRVEGRVERLSEEDSQRYYDTRARGSRIGAWASRQTEVLEPVQGEEGDDGRARLQGWVKEVEERFEGTEKIPVPPFWGGLRVVPETIEFWQGRESRLHDRFRYTRLEGSQGEGEWKIDRLSP